MKTFKQKKLARASKKTAPVPDGPTLDLNSSEVLGWLRQGVGNYCLETGLLVMHKLLEEEMARHCGPWGAQQACRHGTQGGYVVMGGQKVRIQRPRVRSKGGEEVALERYGQFQQRDGLGGSVQRLLRRQVSTRDYAGAIETVGDAYGIRRSSVSREWKAATAVELAALQQRPVPSDICVLMIDGQHYASDCVVAAMGIDAKGVKQVLGLWAGATENATVVKTLLEELVERGLSTDKALLCVIDGSKALAAGIRRVLGSRARIQRCRIHKLRNLCDHLPKELHGQVRWRYRAALEANDAESALKELRKLAAWLERQSVSAAASLREGMEELVTLQRLGVRDLGLLRSLGSTNPIESCFSRCQASTRRVKRWRDQAMVLRWAGSALLWAERGFRRIRGYRALPLLIKALQTNLTTNTILDKRARAA